MECIWNWLWTANVLQSSVSPRASSTGDKQPARRPVAHKLSRSLRGERGAKGLDHLSRGGETLSPRRDSNQLGRIHRSNMSPNLGIISRTKTHLTRVGTNNKCMILRPAPSKKVEEHCHPKYILDHYQFWIILGHRWHFASVKRTRFPAHPSRSGAVRAQRRVTDIVRRERHPHLRSRER